jgi:hypothetical protein
MTKIFDGIRCYCCPCCCVLVDVLFAPSLSVNQAIRALDVDWGIHFVNCLNVSLFLPEEPPSTPDAMQWCVSRRLWVVGGAGMGTMAAALFGLSPFHTFCSLLRGSLVPPHPLTPYPPRPAPPRPGPAPPRPHHAPLHHGFGFQALVPWRLHPGWCRCLQRPGFDRPSCYRRPQDGRFRKQLRR